jgi:hypothetical protein
MLDAIDATAGQLGEAQERNFQKWSILGVYVWPNWFVADTYAAEIGFMKDWLTGRLEWIDSQSTLQPFQRGDSNGSNAVDIADPIFTLAYFFASGPAPSCLDAADANDDGAVDIADAIAELGYLFAGTGPLPEPFKKCGVDPTLDGLGCERYEPCE